MHYWANGSVHLWICSEGPLLIYDNIGHPFLIHFCCQMQLSSKNHNASIFFAMIVYQSKYFLSIQVGKIMETFFDLVEVGGIAHFLG